jgi:hypothetical protein
MTDLKRGDLVKWKGAWTSPAGHLGIVLNRHRFSSRDEECWYEVFLGDCQVIRTPLIFLEKL